MKVIKKSVAALVVVSAIVALTASAGSADAVPAQNASPTWTVPVSGTAFAASDNVTVSALSAGLFLFCDPIDGTAKANRGTGLSGTGIVTIDQLSWTEFGGNCTDETFGTTVSVRIFGLPWKFNALSYNKESTTVAGTITGITLTVTGPLCQLGIGGPNSGPGEVNVTYDNSTGLMAMRGGNLRVLPGASCPVITAGTAVEVEADFVVQPRGILASP